MLGTDRDKIPVTADAREEARLEAVARRFDEIAKRLRCSPLGLARAPIAAVVWCAREKTRKGGAPAKADDVARDLLAYTDELTNG